MLGRLAAGDLFAPGVTGAFRGFAFWLLLSAVVGIAGPPLPRLADRGGGERSGSRS